MTPERIRTLVIVAVIIGFVYMKNKKNESKVVNTPLGETAYSNGGEYENISPMKHDIFKQMTVDLAPVLILSLATQTEIFNWSKPLDTVVGRTGLAILGYFIYYQVMEPYLVNNIPNF